jgi:hypothetical protein
MDLLRTAAQGMDLHAGAGASSRGREKLAKLNERQLSELSTDAYDELLRRNRATDETRGQESEKQVPAFLPPRNDLHPKRNEARKKMAALGDVRFKGLLKDILGEINKRAGTESKDADTKLDGIKEEQEKK